jgi:predicted DNA-binding transcriptional regulator AlpA
MPIEDSKLLSSRQVAELTSLPKSTIRDMAARGEFPAPVEIPHSRRLGWREIQIREWLESLQHRPARSVVGG